MTIGELVQAGAFSGAAGLAVMGRALLSFHEPHAGVINPELMIPEQNRFRQGNPRLAMPLAIFRSE